MQSLLRLTVIIILLYIFYKFVGGYLMPLIAERRLQRYKQRFYDENPHIDSAAVDQHRADQREREGIPFRPRRRRHA